MKIIVIKLGAMGDVVRTSYAVNSFVEANGPGVRVTWITDRSCFDLLRFNPYVHSIVALDTFTETLPKSVDWVFSLDDEYKAAELATRVSSKTITGAFVQNGQVTYSCDSAAWFDMGLVSRFGKAKADLLKQTNDRSHGEIFASLFQVPTVLPAYFGCATIESEWRIRRDQAQKVVGFNLFAGGRWPSKEMPQVESMKLMKAVRQHMLARFDRFKLVVFSDPSNVDRARRYLCDPETAVWDCGASSLDYAAAIRACDYVFSTDSLGLHLSIAQRVPNLSYYAPTSGAEIDTFDIGRKVLSTGADYCSYHPSADNSSLTADRVFEAWLSHISALAEWR